MIKYKTKEIKEKMILKIIYVLIPRMIHQTMTLATRTLT